MLFQPCGGASRDVMSNAMHGTVTRALLVVWGGDTFKLIPCVINTRLEYCESRTLGSAQPTVQTQTTYRPYSTTSDLQVKQLPKNTI